MKNIRIWYVKEGRSVYISHLDMMRCMQRAVKRAGIPVWYTQGFNTHIYMTFSLPLSLGYASDCETLDIRLEEEMAFEEMVKRLNDVLPNELRVLRVAEPKQRPDTIRYADYVITFFKNAQTLKHVWDPFIAQPVITSQKKTKKGHKEVNLKDYVIETSSREEDSCLLVTVRVLAGNENLNPSLLVEAFKREGVPFEDVRIRRTAVLDENMQPFE